MVSGVEDIYQKVLCWCVKNFIMVAFYFGEIVNRSDILFS